MKTSASAFSKTRDPRPDLGMYSRNPEPPLNDEKLKKK